MTTSELIEALKQADPNGYRKVEVELAANGDDDRKIVDVVKGPPSELHPVVLQIEHPRRSARIP